MGLLCPIVVYAGDLAGDPDALPGFNGTAYFDASVGLNLLYVDLDFAVYAPGQYPDDGVLGNDPSNGSEYVYAYQAFNLLGSNRALTTVSVGLIAGVPNSNHSADPLAGVTGGVLPDAIFALPNSVVYDFYPEVNADQHSAVLLFTSPFPPVYGPGSIQSGGLSDQESVPTPLPEPSAALLLLAAGLGLRRR
jgi:hypothetical protein